MLTLLLENDTTIFPLHQIKQKQLETIPGISNKLHRRRAHLLPESIYSQTLSVELIKARSSNRINFSAFANRTVNHYRSPPGTQFPLEIFPRSLHYCGCGASRRRGAVSRDIYLPLALPVSCNSYLPNPNNFSIRRGLICRVSNDIYC